MHNVLIVFEKAQDNYSAYSPDLPGCVATGKTREQVARNMHEAIELHVRELPETNLLVPKSHWTLKRQDVVGRIAISRALTAKGAKKVRRS